MRLLCLNLWNVNEPLEQRMTTLADWLAVERPEIVALQEVSEIGAVTQADWLADAVGYPHVHHDVAWSGNDRGEGLAMLSDLPLEPVAPVSLPDNERDGPRILQQARLATGDGTLHLGNTHLAWRLDDTPTRVRQTARIARELDAVSDPVLLVGDFNDEHDSPPLRELAETGGLVDTCGDDRPTFAGANPWTFQPSLMGRRVDHALARPDGTVSGVSPVLTGEDGPVVSDHYGLEVWLEL